MFAIFLGVLTAWTGPGQPAAAAGGEMFDWPQIERQIEWHRNRSRACGPLSALYVLRQLGHQVNLADALPPATTIGDKGVPLADVVALCRQYEPQARLVSVPEKHLGRLACPCILVVNDRHHAIVLQSYSNRRKTAAVWDPADLAVKTMPLDELHASWSGDAILFTGYPWPSIFLGLANATMLSALFYRQWRKRQQRHRDAPASSGHPAGRRRRGGDAQDNQHEAQ